MEQAKDLTSVEVHRQQVGAYIASHLQPVAVALEMRPSEEEVVMPQEFEVRDYQLDAWGALWDARQSGADRGLIHLATGLGKTSVAVFDVIKFREEFQLRHGREPRILFASHKNEINEQAAQRFAAFLPDTTQGFYNGQDKIKDRTLTFATLQSLYSSLDTFGSDYYDYIIYDEAHHARAETFEAVINHFKPVFQLALTATPDRTDGLDIRGLFGEELYSKGLAEAIAEGYLVDVDYHIVFDEAVKAAMESGFEPETLRALEELLRVPVRNEEIVRNIQEEKRRIGLEDAKTIIFCEDTTHADEIAELMGGRAYHSDIKKDIRDGILADFKVNSISDICTVDMFNEGIDIPDARVIVFLRSTQSPIVFEQQLGRGLRRALGKNQVSVLDFVANVERIARIREMSAAIQRRVIEVRKEKQNGERSYGNEGEGTEYPEQRGLVIHTPHGEFDFDRMAIDLLERWGKLKEAAAANPLNELSNDELISMALRIKPQGPLTQSEINDLSKLKQFITIPGIKKRFGSLPKFQAACGFKVAVERLDVKTMSNDDIVELALKLKNDRPLMLPEIHALSREGRFVSAQFIKSRFGSIQTFREACGFTSFEHIPPEHLTPDDIVNQALSINSERPLGWNEMSRLSQAGEFVTPLTVKKMFGSIDAFYEKCGFVSYEKTKPLDAKTMTDENIVELALQLQPGAPLTQRDIKQFGQKGKFISNDAIIDRFGSLAKFQTLCGFAPNAVGFQGNKRKVSSAREEDMPL